MKKVPLTFLILLFSAWTLSAQGIKWESSYENAFKQARASGKAVVVLITAPTWCGWCVEFSKNVLSNAKVQATLNNGFIALEVLDTSVELQRFDFDGYPTVRIYDKTGKEVKDVYTQDPNRFLALLEPYVAKAVNPVTSSTSIKATTVVAGSAITWREIVDVAQYGEADWSQEVKRVKNLSIEQAKKLAEADPRINYFFFVKGLRMVLPPLGNKGVFTKGEAVFFAGKPWYGSAPGLANAYEKQIASANAPVSNSGQKFSYAKGYYQKIEAGKWQGCDEAGVCTIYRESDTNQEGWIELVGYVAAYGDKTYLAIPENGGMSYYYDDQKEDWIALQELSIENGADSFGVRPGIRTARTRSGSAPVRQQSERR